MPCPPSGCRIRRSGVMQSVLHRVNPNLSAMVGTCRNGDLQAVKAFLPYSSEIP